MDGNSALPEPVAFGSGEDEELFPCRFQYYWMNRTLSDIESNLVPSIKFDNKN